MAQGKIKTKVTVPDLQKKKKNRIKHQAKTTKTIKRAKQRNPKDLLQKEVEKEIRKKIEQDARNCLNT